MENKKNIFNFTNKFRNFLPLTAIFVLTAGLLFYFKEHKQNVNDFIEDGKNNLISFYTQNLKPILFKTDITNEDVFNFALYKNLPIDKEENKVLQIGYDEQSGTEFFEIKPAQINENTKNYKKFTAYLKLNNRQQSQLDSILGSYKDVLYTSVLYNDNNTIAVNSKVSLLRDAILADLMAFAQNMNVRNYENIIPFDYKYNSADIRKAIDVIKDSEEHEQNDFVIFTPDSIFKSEFEFDRKKFNKEMTALNWDMKKVRDELKDMKFEIKVNPVPEIDIDANMAKNYNLKPDSNYCKAFLSKDFMMKGMKDWGDIEKLRVNIEKLTYEINKINIEINTAEANKIKVNMKNFIAPDSTSSFTFNLNLNGLDSLINNSINGFGEKEIKDWEEFGFKMDSLANSFHFNFSDSGVTKFDKQKFKEELKKAKKEISRIKN